MPTPDPLSHSFPRRSPVLFHLIARLQAPPYLSSYSFSARPLLQVRIVSLLHEKSRGRAGEPEDEEEKMGELALQGFVGEVRARNDESCTRGARRVRTRSSRFPQRKGAAPPPLENRSVAGLLRSFLLSFSSFLFPFTRNLSHLSRWPPQPKHAVSHPSALPPSPSPPQVLSSERTARSPSATSSLPRKLLINLLQHPRELPAQFRLQGRLVEPSSLPSQSTRTFVVQHSTRC